MTDLYIISVQSTNLRHLSYVHLVDDSFSPKKSKNTATRFTFETAKKLRRILAKKYEGMLNVRAEKIDEDIQFAYTLVTEETFQEKIVQQLPVLRSL